MALAVSPPTRYFMVLCSLRYTRTKLQNFTFSAHIFTAQGIFDSVTHLCNLDAVMFGVRNYEKGTEHHDDAEENHIHQFGRK